MRDKEAREVDAIMSDRLRAFAVLAAAGMGFGCDFAASSLDAAGAPNPLAGGDPTVAGGCSVAQNDDGTVTFTCPDGST